jgi:hypothetical protein
MLGIGALIEALGSNDPAFIGRFVLCMCTHDFMEDFHKVRAPTLIWLPRESVFA